MILVECVFQGSTPKNMYEKKAFHFDTWQVVDVNEKGNN